MRMPWGKHCEQDIEDLPTDYLRWLAENCEDDDVASAADEECRWRLDHRERD